MRSYSGVRYCAVIFRGGFTGGMHVGTLLVRAACMVWGVQRAAGPQGPTRSDKTVIIPRINQPNISLLVPVNGFLPL